jgi:hypothetical protein
MLVCLAVLTATTARGQTCSVPDGNSLDTAGCTGEDQVIVDADGHVGINTPDPEAALEVAGEMAVSYPMPAGDGVQGNLSIYLEGNKAAGTFDWWWRLLTSDPDGGFGARPRAFEIWEYPSETAAPEGDSFQCCRPRLVVDTSYGRTPPPPLVLTRAGRLGVGTLTPQAGVDVATGGVAVAGTPVIDEQGRWVGTRRGLGRTVAVCIEPGDSTTCCQGGWEIVGEQWADPNESGTCRAEADTGSCELAIPAGASGRTGHCCVCGPA